MIAAWRPGMPMPIASRSAGRLVLAGRIQANGQIYNKKNRATYRLIRRLGTDLDLPATFRILSRGKRGTNRSSDLVLIQFPGQTAFRGRERIFCSTMNHVPARDAKSL